MGTYFSTLSWPGRNFVEGVVKGVGLGVAAVGNSGALAVGGLLHRQAAPRLELKLPGVERPDAHRDAHCDLGRHDLVAGRVLRVRAGRHVGAR